MIIMLSTKKNIFFADFPMERKTPVVYADGVYEVIDERVRGNVLVISNLTQHGLSGLGSRRRTAFFIFFGERPYTAGCNNLPIHM